jgi:hypothetical protein
MKGSNFELDEELCRAQLNMGSERTHVRIVVNVNKPTRVIGLVQKDAEKQNRLSCQAGRILH